MGYQRKENLRKLARLAGAALRKAPRHPLIVLRAIRIAGWIVILSLLIKITSLPRALKLVSAKVRQAPPQSSAQIQRLAQAVDTLLGLDFFVFRPSCWKRAIILHRYLALEGFASRVNFGMRKVADGGVAGHAWLESDGEPILEAVPPDYTITFSFPNDLPEKIDFALQQ